MDRGSESCIKNFTYIEQIKEKRGDLTFRAPKMRSNKKQHRGHGSYHGPYLIYESFVYTVLTTLHYCTSLV